MDHAELVIAGHVAWFSLLASAGMPSRRVGGGLAVTTGTSSNSDNGVFVDPELVDLDELDVALRWLRSSGMPASCVLSAEARTGLVTQLEGLGLQADRGATVMGRTLADYQPPASTVDGYEVREVLTVEDLGQGLAALGEDWYGASERRLRIRVCMAIGLGGASRVRHWVARRDGHAVGMATMFRFDRFVELAQCGVERAHRRRGVARALTGARLRAAIDAGASTAVLGPSPDGYQLHRQHGFELSPALRNRWFHVQAAPADRQHRARA